MDSDLLYLLTLFLNFIGMAFSLWLAIYILARSQLNHLAFRAIAALLALSLYYYGAFTWIVDPSTDTGALRSLGIVIALVATYDLTFYLLPDELRSKRYWLARAILLVSLIVIVLLFQAPAPAEGDCDPRYTCTPQYSTLWSLIDLFILLVFFAILYNLWQIKKSGGWIQSGTFYLAVLLAASSIGYSFLGALFNVDLPRFIANALVLCALGLLGYSVSAPSGPGDTPHGTIRFPDHIRHHRYHIGDLSPGRLADGPLDGSHFALFGAGHFYTFRL